ncbi:hypothetical protein H4219_005828 [Mycoemilia scoparia]|uniref:Uncharacterized protein n=1 Tax=Mycoemilia scoparia TaxID=417184 RepID=A0A9W7ZL65_9FUNG|nr:hypothetical protein H4219_005828 [Mycoemilia scoparia]
MFGQFHGEELESYYIDGLEIDDENEFKQKISKIVDECSIHSVEFNGNAIKTSQTLDYVGDSLESSKPFILVIGYSEKHFNLLKIQVTLFDLNL